MPSTFFAYDVASSALQANQVAVDVISNNTANIDTPGYTRQVPVLSENIPFSSLSSGTGQPGALGTGVSIASIDRIRNSYTDQQVWSANSVQGAVSNLSTTLNEVQTAYNEPSSSGISEQLTSFFNSFSNLAANPQSGAIRATVINAAQSLTNSFQTVSSALSQISPQISGQIADSITQVNTIAKQVAGLNSQITLSIASGSQPNDLEDQRGQLLTQLSNLVNIQVNPATNSTTGQPTGALNVYVSGFNLVQDGTATTLPPATTATNGTQSLVTASGTTIPLTGGAIYGLIQAGSKLQTYRSNLDSVATNLASAVNHIQETGTGLDGSTGIPFFTTQTSPSGAGAAATININSIIVNNPNAIAAASSPVPPNTVALGNGDNATQIAALNTTPVVNGLSLNDYYSAQVAGVGSDTQTAKNDATNQQTIVTQLQNLQSSVSGVNLDQELTNMMEYQRSYQAAAHVMTIADDMLLDVINGLGSGATALA